MGVMKKREYFGEKNRLYTKVYDGFHVKRKGGRLPAEKNFNCNCENGELKRGIGLLTYYDGGGNRVEASLGTSVLGTYSAKIKESQTAEEKEWFFFWGADGCIYSRNVETGATMKRGNVGEWLSYCAFKTETETIYHLFAGETAAFGTVNGVDFTRLLTGEFQAACLIKDRYFVAEKGGRARYSAAFDPYAFDGDSDGGGTLYTPAEYGEIVGLAAEGDGGYIFLQKGIFRLSVFADTSDFYLEKLGYAGGEICVGSIVETGHGVLFLATDGLYRAKGKEVKKTGEDFEIYPSASYRCRTGKCEDRTLIEYRMELADGNTETKRVALSADGKEGFFVDNYGALGGTEFCCAGSVVYKFDKKSPVAQYRRPPYFTTPFLDFGRAKRKRLKGIRLFGTGKGYFLVSVDDIQHEYDVEFVNGSVFVRLTEVGERFSFDFYPAVGAAFKRVEIEYYCAER